MIRRPPRSTLDRSSAASDVYKRQARYFAGERLPERELLAVYDDWGRWRYLAYWFEMWLADPEA